MMKLQNIETLLLQEMEDVKGGTGGTCRCEMGAGQSSQEGGTCVCSQGGAGQLLVKPSTCLCGNGGAAQV